MKVKANKPMPVKRVTYPISSTLSFMMWTSKLKKQVFTYNIKSSVLPNNIIFNYPLSTTHDNTKNH